MPRVRSTAASSPARAPSASQKHTDARKSQYSESVANAVEEIDSLIGSGRLAPGQRLIEADLAGQLGLGRVPIREALRILAGDGVVELMPNRGARVRIFSHRHIAEMLRALVALLCAGIEEFVESDSYADGMRRLDALNREIADRRETMDGYGLLEVMARYQATIFEASGNTYLVEIHRRVHFHHYNRQIIDAVGFVRLSRITTVYTQATQALRKRDAARASTLFRKSMHETVKLLEELAVAERARAAAR